MGKLSMNIPACPWPRNIVEEVTGFAERFAQTLPKIKMPAIRGKKGWCGCLEDDEPPEITYCVVDSGGSLTLQAITPTQPMPTTDELNAKFAELVDELDLTATNKEAMMSLPPEKKWQIYCSRKKNSEMEETDSQQPEHYVERVRVLAQLPYPENNEEEVLVRTRQLDALKTALRTQLDSFVQRFLDGSGVPALLDFLSAMQFKTAQSSIHTSLIGCLKALMNNSNGRAHVLAHPTGLNIIAQSLITDNIKTKVAVLEILGAVCLVPGGHRKVLQAMLHYQAYAYERTRFQGIVNDLDKSVGVYKDDVSLKTAIMSFINAVLSYGPGQEHLEFRLHLRYEFLMLGIQPVIDKLRTYENDTLNRHLNFFEMIRNEDEREFARKFQEEHVDTKSATAMFDLLRRKLAHSAAYPHFLAMLEHCLLLPLDLGSHPHHWLLFDRVVQQIVLQTDDGADVDLAPIQLDVKTLVQLLADEEALMLARTKAQELERENQDISVKLAKKEQELDFRNQEREDIEASLTRTKERLEKEVSVHLETKQKLNAVEYRASELEHQFHYERDERLRLEHVLSSLPDDAKTISLKSELEREYKAPAKPNPPPPPPPFTMAPPMPPLAPGLPPPPCAPPPLPKLDQKKNIPRPSHRLKCFNWSKLPDAKLGGTIWTELDETKLYRVLPLDDLDREFGTFNKNGITTDGSVEDLRLLPSNKNRSKSVSVIDSRRGQNCTILLSKLKMSDAEMCAAILSMDADQQLPLDMVDQLLKFTPSSEEVALLEERADELDTLARADRFLYEISKIPHYEQRLRALAFKKRFGQSINEIMPRIKSVTEASKQVARSRRLRKLLELILAVGNYMNQARGNATGFRLASLTRLRDTKSSHNKGTTLLHHLVDIIEKTFKEILKIDEDLSAVRDASKVSLGELEKDMGALRLGLKQVEREVEFHRAATARPPTDCFLPVMMEFLSSATCKFSELEDLFQDMKSRFDRAVRLFGEDDTSIQPDEFFGMFDAFLCALHEARSDNENNRRRKEEEEKRAKQEAELRKRTIERRSSKVESSEKIKNGLMNDSNGDITKDLKGEKREFDDLISALRTGDVFGEDMAKLKRSRKARLANGTGGSPPRYSSNNSLSREDSRERVLTNARL